MTRMAQEEVYREDEMANPPDIKAFTVDRHSFVENFMVCIFVLLCCAIAAARLCSES